MVKVAPDIRLRAEVLSGVKISNPRRLIVFVQTGALHIHDETSRRGSIRTREVEAWRGHTRACRGDPTRGSLDPEQWANNGVSQLSKYLPNASFSSTIPVPWETPRGLDESHGDGTDRLVGRLPTRLVTLLGRVWEKEVQCWRLRKPCIWGN